MTQFYNETIVDPNTIDRQRFIKGAEASCKANGFTTILSALWEAGIIPEDSENDRDSARPLTELLLANGFRRDTTSKGGRRQFKERYFTPTGYHSIAIRDKFTH